MRFLNFVALSWLVRSIFSHIVFTKEINRTYILKLLHQGSCREFYGPLGMVGKKNKSAYYTFKKRLLRLLDFKSS